MNEFICMKCHIWSIATLHVSGAYPALHVLSINSVVHNAKIKVAVSVDKQRTLIRIYMEKYNSV